MKFAKKKLNGNVAELGVYKGKFAKYINQYFPERKFYLFDTFTGFDKRDMEKEKSKSFSQAGQNFSDTSLESVLNRMPYPQNCIPVKGYFPESAVHVDDSFVFVSLDADLFEPLYSGLLFFYPKLVAGGYIFIHDFNNDAYKGARQAVEQFCDGTKNQFSAGTGSWRFCHHHEMTISRFDSSGYLFRRQGKSDRIVFEMIFM